MKLLHNHFIEMTPRQYAEHLIKLGQTSGISELTIRRRCEAGMLDCYRIGKHWKIKVGRAGEIT